MNDKPTEEELNAKPRLLLVEDTPPLRHIFGRVLRLHGFNVMEATNGIEALSRVADFHPQFILTDLMMPVMGGVEFIRKLRAGVSGAKIPVVAFTANPTALAERQAREAGADEFLSKPVDLTDLIGRLRALRRN
jgi:CheY-like chemotaxis protein